MRSFDRPYEGLKIVDFAQGLAGPYCAAILAQQGASVIKVEPPFGDWARNMGRGEGGFTSISIAANIGKRGLALDMTKPEARAIALALTERADLVIESFRPGVMRKLGLGYEAVAARNPGIVYASVSGFGQQGPYANLPATDSVLQAMSGLMAMNADETGAPRRIKMLIADTITAVYAAQRVGSALYGRALGRGGGHVQVSLLEACAAFQATPILDDAMFPGTPPPPVTIPSGTFATRDGYVNIIALSDAMYASLAEALDRPDWAQDQSFRSMAARNANAKACLAELQGAVAARGTAELVELLRRRDVLCGAAQNYAMLRSDQQVAYLRLFGAVAVAGFGDLPVPQLPGLPPVERLAAPPSIGQHTDEILAELGLTPEETAAMREAGIVR